MNTKTKTFISNQGEVFEGTQKELMNTYGIKHKMGFSRPSGAVDDNGDRWKEYEEGVTFTKPKLYLNAKLYHSTDIKGKYTEIISPSATATEYNLMKEGVIKYNQDFINEVEAKYELIDNPKPKFISGKSINDTDWDAIIDSIPEMEEEYSELWAK